MISLMFIAGIVVACVALPVGFAIYWIFRGVSWAVNEYLDSEISKRGRGE